MAYTIRPLSFAEVLDRAFAVLKDHFWLIVSISAVVYLPWGAMQVFEQLASAPLRVVIAIVSGLALLIATPVMGVAIATAVAKVYLDQPITVDEAYRSTGSILAQVLGTYLVSGLLLILAFIALVIPGIYFAICWALLPPVMVIEQRFGMAAMRRSRELVRGVWWRTLGIAAVAAVIAQIPASALNFLWVHIPILGPLLYAATLAVSSTYSAVVLVIYYFDRRCRTEDFDLRLLAEQIRAETGGAAPAVPGTSSIA